MDSDFRFLGEPDRELALGVLSRRNSALSTRIREESSISRSDAAEIINTLSDEISDNLDVDWEPTDYGRHISQILAKINAIRIAEWPQ